MKNRRRLLVFGLLAASALFLEVFGRHVDREIARRAAEREACGVVTITREVLPPVTCARANP